MRPSLKSSIRPASSPSKKRSRQQRGLGERERTLTTGTLHLEDALLGPSVLKGADEGRLDGEKGPAGVSGRGRGDGRAVDDALVAGLDGRAVDRQVQRRHGEGVEQPTAVRLRGEPGR